MEQYKIILLLQLEVPGMVDLILPVQFHIIHSNKIITASGSTWLIIIHV